ncbi:MAG: hypothetical protein AAFN77_18065 [Planctomycetota bacterium]
MKFYVELPQSTGITPDELAEQWNKDSAAANLGEASVDSSAPKAIGEAVGQIVISVATGVLSSVIYDQLKALLAKHKEKTMLGDLKDDEGASSTRVTKAEENA